jgi:hypothetical protein
MSDSESETVSVAPTEKRGRGAPKGKRTPTPLQLEMLAKARAKANEIRKQQQIVKQETYDEIVDEIQRFEPDIKMPPNVPKPLDTEKAWSKEFKPPRSGPPPDLLNVCESVVTPDEIRNQKKNENENETKKNETKKKKTRIIIEQSSSDSDEFESNDHVIFVKRKGRKDDIKKTSNVNDNVNANVDLFDGVPTPTNPYASINKFAPVQSSYFNKKFY